MERTVTLNPSEVATLDRQDPSTASGGGFQGLLVKLQKRLDRTNSKLKLDDGDLHRILLTHSTTGRADGKIALCGFLAARLDLHWVDRWRVQHLTRPRPEDARSSFSCLCSRETFTRRLLVRS